MTMSAKSPDALQIPSFDLPTELWIKIFTYLQQGDLQQVRLTSKHWADVASLPKLMENLKLKITKHNLEAVKMHLEASYDVDSDGACFHMRYQCLELINLSVSDSLQYILQRLGRYVHYLKLHKSPVFENLYNNLPNLQELRISCMRSMPEGRNFIAMDLNNFRNLKTLELDYSGVSRKIKSRLLQQLTRELTVVKLEQLHVEHTIEHEALLLQVLETHASTMQHINLSLFLPPTMGLVLWSYIFAQLSALHTIKLSGSCHYSWLDVLFRNLPAATPLRHVDLGGIVEVNDELIKYIVNKWPLQQLELMFCVNISDEGLRDLQYLRGSLHTLNVSFCGCLTKRGLLEGIASQLNVVLQHLYLNDMSDLDEQSICLLAERLPNLLTLSLDNCGYAVTDTALSHVFRYQTHLQTLILNDCNRLTDEAFLGCGNIWYPISRLRGLRTLALRGCRNLSNRTLISALKFNELRNLKLGYCHRFSAAGIAEMVTNCPAIENLVISSCLMLDDDAVLYIAKGLKRLHKLNLSNCLNLTERAIDYIVEHCHVLQELVLCGLDSFEMFEVQKRLQHLKPQLKEVQF